MSASIRLFRGAFGHVSILHVLSDLVTHAHGEAHIIIWLEGAAGEMTIAGQRVPLGPCTAAAVNPFEPHSHAVPREGGHFLAFYIDPDWARDRRGLGDGAPLFSRPDIPLDPWLHRSAVDLLGPLDECCSPDMADYEIERFIDSVIDAAEAAAPRRRAGRMRGGQDFRVRKSMQLMREKVAERISFEEVAKSVGMSRPHFFALFKEQTRLTPNVYWNTLRMEEALRQLQADKEPLTAVASNLGFTTQGNFTRFFRDHAGVPPTVYREAARAV
jgi:AraC-like DNA-binding protein